MANAKITSLSDSSSEDDAQPHWGLGSFKTSHNSDSRPTFNNQTRSSVIVSTNKPQTSYNEASSTRSQEDSEDESDSSFDSSDSKPTFGTDISRAHENLFKRKAPAETVLNPRAEKMMKMMGHEESKGLGKNDQGRVANSSDSKPTIGTDISRAHKNLFKRKAPAETVLNPRAEKMMKMMGHEESKGLGKNDQGRVAHSSDSKPTIGTDISRAHKNLIKCKAPAETVLNPRAEKMMKMMGYEEGKGLGKNAQGRVAPIELSTQRGRRGLGLAVSSLLQAADLEWDSSKEYIEVQERVSWAPESAEPPLELSELRTWMVEGPKKLTIDDETEFCDPEVLREVLNSKSVFDSLSPQELNSARSRSNPFETIRGGMFLNRAAMKMANLDAVFDFMFTDPRLEDGTSFVQPNELLYFADVCAGPGGFSEYVLWRKKWEAKGFGFTLRNNNDFKLEDFFAGPSESFETYYGEKGDGDVYDPINIRSLRKLVLENTDNKGVHFMMADGGFSVEGQENLQEILSKRLYLCQFLVALSIVRTGGHFVCKLFDVFTPFSVGLIYLMYRAFKRISIHKPNTSRPANSERYIICKGKQEWAKDIGDYLFEVNCRLGELSSASSQQDVNEIVPLALLKKDREFCDYITQSNNELGNRQTVGLAKIAAFCRDSNLREDRQVELRKQCIEFWNVPDKPRVAPRRSNANDKFEELTRNVDQSLLSKNATMVNKTSLQAAVKSPYDWRCVVVSAAKDKSERTFYLGLGRSSVFRWDKSRWVKVDIALELSRDTLVYGEVVWEMKGEGRSQRRVPAFHIIDAWCLGGKDVHALHLKDRHDWCRKFAQAMNKPSNSKLAPVRAKEMYKLEEVEQIFDKLDVSYVKSLGDKIVYTIEDVEPKIVLPSGLLFYKSTQMPWMVALSRSQRRKYWFHTLNKTSVFECPRDSVMDAWKAHEERLAWWWDYGVRVHVIQDANPDEFHKEDLLRFISKLMNS